MSVPWITAFAILWLVVTLLGFSVVGMMRRAIAVLERAERQPTLDLGGVKPLTRLPRFQLLNDAGETVMSDQLLRETTLLVFMEAGCKPCRALARSLDGADREVAGMPLVIVLDDRGEVEEFALPQTSRSSASAAERCRGSSRARSRPTPSLSTRRASCSTVSFRARWLTLSCWLAGNGPKTLLPK